MYKHFINTGYLTEFRMPYRILCKGTFWKSREARSGLVLTPSRCTSLHKIRDGIEFREQV